MCKQEVQKSSFSQTREQALGPLLGREVGVPPLQGAARCHTGVKHPPARGLNPCSACSSLGETLGCASHTLRSHHRWAWEACPVLQSSMPVQDLHAVEAYRAKNIFSQSLQHHISAFEKYRDAACSINVCGQFLGLTTTQTKLTASVHPKRALMDHGCCSRLP